MVQIKNKKFQFFYVDETLEKPNKIRKRHFIHSKSSSGFWVHVRDLTQAERLQHDAVSHSVALQILVGHNETILDNWERLIVLDNRGRAHKILQKPDEYDYNRNDLKLLVTRFEDKNDYKGDIYDERV